MYPLLLRNSSLCNETNYTRDEERESSLDLRKFFGEDKYEGCFRNLFSWKKRGK